MLDKLAAQQSCSRGVQGDAVLDYYGDEGRVTGSVLYYAVAPERLRFDVVSPFGVAISTLTSNGTDFALSDLQNGQFLHGPASQCNVARFTRVPIPPFALVQLLVGSAPVVRHRPEQAQLSWQSGFFSDGHYLLTLSGNNQSFEEIAVALHQDDFERPWAEQRFRLKSVRVAQKGVDLYLASLKGHRTVRTRAPAPDPDGLGPPLPPSGPPCSAELPETLRIEVPTQGTDLVFRHKEQWHNPPLPFGVFEQRCTSGVSCSLASCD
jgi:hypothetical protein